MGNNEPKENEMNNRRSKSSRKRKNSFWKIFFSAIGAVCLAVILVFSFVIYKDSKEGKANSEEQSMQEEDESVEAEELDDEDDSESEDNDSSYYDGDDSESEDDDSSYDSDDSGYDNEDVDYTLELEQTVAQYFKIYGEGDLDNLDTIIEPSTPLYSDKYTEMEELAADGSTASLNTFMFDTIDKYDDTTYIITLDEDFIIQDSSGDTSSYVQRCEYTIQLINGGFYIMDINII